MTFRPARLGTPRGAVGPATIFDPGKGGGGGADFAILGGNGGAGGADTLDFRRFGGGGPGAGGGASGADLPIFDAIFGLEKDLESDCVVSKPVSVFGGEWLE